MPMLTSWKRAMARLSAIMRAAEAAGASAQPLLINSHVYRLDMLAYVDGTFDEYGFFWHKMLLDGLTTMFRTSVQWQHASHARATMSEPQSAAQYLHTHLLLGVFPMLPVIHNDHALSPDASYDGVFVRYGRLFDALRGRRWLLTAHAAMVVAAQAHTAAATAGTGQGQANAFAMPDGTFVAVVVQSGGAGRHAPPLSFSLPLTVAVELRLPASVTNVTRVRAMHPGTDVQPSVQHASSRVAGSGELRVRMAAVPVVEGCALLKVTVQADV